MLSFSYTFILRYFVKRAPCVYARNEGQIKCTMPTGIIDTSQAYNLAYACMGGAGTIKADGGPRLQRSQLHAESEHVRRPM